MRKTTIKVRKYITTIECIIAWPEGGDELCLHSKKGDRLLK